MRKMNTIENGTDFAACKMGKLDAACVRYGLGRNSIQKMAKEAGATVRLENVAFSISRFWMLT